MKLPFDDKPLPKGQTATSSKPVSVSNVQALRLFKAVEHPCGHCEVVPITAKLCHKLMLSGDLLLAARNMPFGHGEMLFEHFLIHSDFLAHASQPPP